MFQRNRYLQELIQRQGNHLIKVITGIRRAGKTFLLNHIFYSYLVKQENIKEDHILRFSFDNMENIMALDSYLPNLPTTRRTMGQELVNARKFIKYVQERTSGKGTYYLLLDEIQNLEDFVRVLNGFLDHENFDVYVTGSNSHMLSSEVDTEFSGRADRIHLLPLSFEEFLSGTKMEKRDALEEYLRYGGIPLVQLMPSDEAKRNEASSILNETYIKDIVNRHPNVDTLRLSDTLRVIASMISTPINPTKIERTFDSVYHLHLSNDTIGNYISWFEEAYLLHKAFRYNVRGRQYIGTPYKVYYEDIGIRNAALDFREIDETDLIENLVYNELRYRGLKVDVGVVPVREKTDRTDKNGNPIYGEKLTEVDFVCHRGGKTYYVQVALSIDNQQQKDQEYESLRHIADSFKKIIIVKEEGKRYYTQEGFLRISLLDFLLDPNSLDS